jgi:predicted RNase H-like HicB family nuclease
MTREEALENIRWALVNYLDDNPSEDEELIDKSFNKIREEKDNEN